MTSQAAGFRPTVEPNVSQGRNGMWDMDGYAEHLRGEEGMGSGDGSGCWGFGVVGDVKRPRQ